MLEIIPAILTNDPRELEDKIRRVEGLTQRVQIDTVDGVFSKNRTLDLLALGKIETELLLDAHLMVKEPVHWVEKCARAMIDRVIAQIELMSDQVEFVGKVQEVGAQVGLAIDLKTPVSDIDETILGDLDVILVMSVKAGFGGQSFNESVLSKISELSELRKKGSRFRICVDGGINLENISKVRLAGADEVAVGSSLFGGDMEGNIDRLRKAAYKNGS